MKNITLRKIFCILMAVMLLLPAFSVLALAVDTDNGEIKKITSQPTAQKPTVETNKNEDVKKYSWYRMFLSDYYRLAPNDGIVDGQSLVEDIYSGYYLDGKWMSDSGYINIGVTAIDGDIVKVTFIDGFDGYACLYHGEDLAEQNDGSYIYTVSDLDQGYVDLEICNDNNEPIEAIVEIVRDGESYPVFDSIDFTNKKYYLDDVDSGFYDGEKWISTKVYSEQELDIEFSFEDCYTIKITLNDGFVGTAFLLTTDVSEDNEYVELEIVDGVITYVADGDVNQFEIMIYSDHEFTAEITLANDDIELEVVDETLYDNERMMYFCDYIYGGSYEDDAWISDEEDTINFDVYLYEDSIITFKPSDDFDGNIRLYDYQEEESIQLNAENGEYTYEVTKDGYFEVYIYFDEQYTVEILAQTKEIQLVEGQTEKTFKPSEMGSYYADVEFKDGTVLTSNIFEINSLVIFNTNGGTPLDILAVTTLTEISKTEREGFVLEGWYLDKELIEKPELPLDISGIVNLYAKWSKCDHKSSTNKPTCTEDVECTVCKADYKATGHSYNSSYTAENGKHFYECTDCGAKQGESDHSFGEWTVTKYAERNTQGEEKRACTVCGHIESRVIEPLDDLSNGAIVGIIIGSGALLALIAVATFILIKRKRVK